MSPASSSRSAFDRLYDGGAAVSGANDVQGPLVRGVEHVARTVGSRIAGSSRWCRGDDDHLGLIEGESPQNRVLVGVVFSGARLQEPEVPGEAHCLGSVLDPALVVERPNMRTNGVGTDAELGSDLSILCTG